MIFSRVVTRHWRERLLSFSLAMAMVISGLAWGQEKRSRQDGLQTSISSITAGENNFHMILFGRTFLWDNQAAQKIPPVLPHGELNYGLLDWLDITAGLNAMSYSLQPGSVYLRTKVTTPDTKILRLIGLGLQSEVKRNLTHSFPSNGFRVKNEGFGPEGYLYGGSGVFNSLRLTVAGDIEGIRLASWLPLKGYLNLGYETGILGSAVEADNGRISKETGKKIATRDATTIPMSLGLQLKTYGSDFFIEIEGVPFYKQVENYTKAWLQGETANPYTRFNMVEKSFDVHLFETPWYVNTGSRLKYPGGLELMGGFSWLLSQDRGSRLGPCTHDNTCLDGATDGFSPFYPQWKVFGQIRYPLNFTQPSSELYRSFLLRRYQDHRKRIDVESTLRNSQGDPGLNEEEKRLKRLMERRKEADEKAMDLK
jgi:hypothetical protein